ncbi:MAG: 2-C-methyl-D-erythritol 2,4-cyclodiphosphate synthase [Fusobacteriaceae bacterium]
MIRIGNGYDVHKLVKGRDLILGGVKIPHDKGVLGHSDGDVLIHAIIDALLGALALGDIGQHFPDTDNKYLNINSMILLEKVKNIIEKKGYSIINLDSIIVLQNPKIKNYIEFMQEKISTVLNIKKDCVSVKATTEEKLGFTGDESGVKSYCVVLLQNKKGTI